jgi:hypothetical protein
MRAFVAVLEGGRFVTPLLNSGRRGFLSSKDRCVAAEIAAQLLGIVVVDGAGMGQRLGDAEFVKFIDDLTRLNFELPRQLIDSDLTHV